MSSIPADVFVPRICRVAGVIREAADTATLTLIPASGEAPQSRPGQFNMLYAFGVGEAAISFSGDPADRTRMVHTVRAVGAVSRAISRLAVGSSLGVRGPFGTGWPLEGADGRDLVIVGGGLGLAPLRPAIYHALKHREQYGRVIILIGMRGPGEILYREELQHWRGQLDVELEVSVDRADAGWRGKVGVVTTLIPAMSLDPANTLALVCGPEIMMRFTANALCAAGIALDRIYLSMERNMKCAVGLCGHCQFGPTFVCKDGPVMRLDRIADIFALREI